MKTKLLEIKQILVEKDVYPRFSPNFITVGKYANAMTNGDIFPAITVGQIAGKYYLVDGMHRITAMKGLKQTHVTAEVLDVKDKREIYVEAVKRNMTHGENFSTQETTNIVLTLEKWNLSQEEISQIVRIPVIKLTPFIAKRTATYFNSTTNLSETVALRSTLKHLAGTVQEDGALDGQNHLVGSRSQLSLIDSLIQMSRSGWFDLQNKDIVQSLITLQDLLLKMNLSMPIEVKVKKEKK